MNDCGCPEYQRLSRRRFLGKSAGVTAAGFLGLANPELLFAKSGPKAKAKNIILLWMSGGQSHIDTWDPKPGTDTGGPFEAIKTAAKGIQISQHLPNTAKQFKDISLIRSLTSREGSHERAAYLMHTGYKPLGSFQHSTLGSVVAKMKDRLNDDLPPYVTIGGRTWPAGFLGSHYAPFHIGDPNNPTDNLEFHRSIDAKRFQRRLKLLGQFDRKFAKQYRGKEVVEAYTNHFQAAYDMMRSPGVAAFDLDKEPADIRERYGATFFGQGCLLARRLVQVGIRFVEVTLPGWDTHGDNFTQVANLCSDLDQAYSSLISDLRRLDLLDTTLVLLCSEFGRTPQINAGNGRDHWPRVWSAAIAGGGIKGGQLVGASTPGGEEVDKDPIQVGQLHATICHALDINPKEMNYAQDGRPIRVVEDTKSSHIATLIS